MAKILSRLKQQPGTTGDGRPLPIDSFEVRGSSLPLISLFLLSLSLPYPSLCLASASSRPRAAADRASHNRPRAAADCAAREPPPAAEAREPPPRRRAPAATERADAVKSWPRAGCRRRRRHKARGPTATTKHEAYRRAERAAAGHCGGSARAAGAGRRGSRPSVFFLTF